MTNAKQKHPWFDLEPDLQVVLSDRRGEPVDPNRLRESNERIANQVEKSAERILRRWGLRNTLENGKDVAQTWQVVMRDGAFDRCDERAAHCYGYAVLKFLCMAASRQTRRTRLLAEGFDQAGKEPSPLADAIAREELVLFQQALQALPSQQRAAICPWSLPAGRCCADRARKMVYRNRYRGRQRLLRWFARYRDPRT